MKLHRHVAGVVALLLVAQCGGSTGGSGSSLTYSQTVSAYTSEGLNSSTLGKALSDAYSAFLLHDIASATDPATTDTKAAALVTAFDAYTTHIENLQAYASTTFDVAVSTNLTGDSFVTKAPGTIGTTAGQTLVNLRDALEAKKLVCDAILANYNSLTDIVAKAQKLSEYNTCAAELQAQAAADGFKITVVKAAGSVVGAAVVKGALGYIGVAGIYFVGGATVVVSAPAAAVIVIASSIGGGILGSKIAGAVYDYCTSGSGTSSKGMSVGKTVGSTEYCSIASTSGVTGSPMTLVAAPGTGTLQVFVDGFAPVSIGGVTVAQGQTVTVNVTLVPLTDVTDSSVTDVNSAGSQSTSTTATTTAGSCTDVISVVANSVPVAPSAGQTVTVTATLIPAVSGCTIPYTVSGTDGYAASGSPTSDSAGQMSFTIPGGAANVHDVVTISESASAVEASLAYTFQ